MSVFMNAIKDEKDSHRKKVLLETKEILHCITIITLIS